MPKKEKYSSLYKVNSMLSKRINKSNTFYYIFVALNALVITTILSVSILTPLVSFESIEEMRLFLDIILFFVFIMDVLLFSIRSQSKTAIELYHITYYPISKFQKVLFQFFVLITDIRVIIFIGSYLIFIIFFILRNRVFDILICSLFWFLFVASIIAWYLVIQKASSSLSKIFRQRLSNYTYLLIFLSSFMITLKGEAFFFYIPVTSYIGNGIFALIFHDLWQVSLNLIYLIVSFIIGAFVMLYAYRNE